MRNVVVPRSPTITPTAITIAVLLIILHSAAWLLRDLIIDGQTIVATLSIISAINLALYIMLRTRFPQFARIILQAVYIFHILFFLLSFVELRKF